VCIAQQSSKCKEVKKHNFYFARLPPARCGISARNALSLQIKPGFLNARVILRRALNRLLAPCYGMVSLGFPLGTCRDARQPVPAGIGIPRVDTSTPTGEIVSWERSGWTRRTCTGAHITEAGDADGTRTNRIFRSPDLPRHRRQRKNDSEDQIEPSLLIASRIQVVLRCCSFSTSFYADKVFRFL